MEGTGELHPSFLHTLHQSRTGFHGWFIFRSLAGRELQEVDSFLGSAESAHNGWLFSTPAQLQFSPQWLWGGQVTARTACPALSSGNKNLYFLRERPLGSPGVTLGGAGLSSSVVTSREGQRKLSQNLIILQNKFIISFQPTFMRASELALRKIIVFLHAFFCFSVISNWIISTFLNLRISKFMTRASQNTSWKQENTTTVTCLIVTRL